MKILVVGGGAREHALLWAFGAGHELICAPGNPGIEALARCVPIAAADVGAIAGLAVREKVDLVVVGPEAPLCAGLGDMIVAANIPCFGPGAAGARLEGSKAYAKEFFARHNIPTAAFSICDDMSQVDDALAVLGDRVVVKADGLCAGKGVTVCSSRAEARTVAESILVGRVFGDAGRKIVIEQRLTGREASVFAVTDGKALALLPIVEDHKALGDGDVGPNTGGMGTVCPAATLDDAGLERVRREILEPTLAGLAAEGVRYRGVLFAGIMVAPDGTPNLLEYNVRFGDPETEALVARWGRGAGLATLLHGAATGELGPPPALAHAAATCVVMAAPGYPMAPETGAPITGLDEAEGLPDVAVFHAGTRRLDDAVVTSGGRVLAVTAWGADVDAARARAYAACDRIDFPGKQLRRDIGRRLATQD